MTLEGSAARENTESGESSREKLMSRRTDYNPWGLMVAQLIAKKQTSIREVGERMGEMGFYRKHPMNALNHAMQMKGIKAVTYPLSVCVGRALDLDDEEWEQLHVAGTKAGDLALQIGSEDCDVEEEVEEAPSLE